MFVAFGRRARRRLGRFAAQRLVVPSGRAVAAAMTARAAVVLVIGGALRAAFLVDQRLPVGDRNLIIVGVDFAER